MTPGSNGNNVPSTQVGDGNVTLHIRRQDGPTEAARWEIFAVPKRPNMNVISCLQYIAAHPVTVEGKQTTPPVYDSGCLEEVCGSCTMLINGKSRQSCSALVNKLGDTITLEPMSKFPVIRDLFVNRQRLFDDLKRIKAWVPIDGTYDLGSGPPISLELQEEILFTWNSGFGNNHPGVTEDVLGTHGTIARGQQIRYLPQRVNRPGGAELMGQTPTVPRAHMQNFLDAVLDASYLPIRFISLLGLMTSALGVLGR